MWNTLKGWLGGLLSHARELFLRLADRPVGRWVEGSYAESNNRVFFFLPQSKRTYHLYLPRRYSATRAAPLVVMLHGCKQDAASFASGTRMNELADQEGFVVLYPEQKRMANAQRCWNWFDSSAQRGHGEAALIAGMVREVLRSHAIDPSRVYIAGLSAGGAMTSIMASCYGNLFAACAIHSGLMYRAAESVSQASRAMQHSSRASAQEAARHAMAHETFDFVPVLVIHGTADSVVNPVNADQVVEQFIAMGTPTRVNGAPVAEFASSKAAGGRRGFEIRDYRSGDLLLTRKILVHGLDHAWSGGNGAHPFNDPFGPDASRMIWDFFSEFQRSELKNNVAANFK
ncbi:MAG TPA: PHB depolymerase family esterase [Burkholderiales bacterium]|nr:PHB depolymerase family esterase [Burkholderiales bacterium]